MQRIVQFSRLAAAVLVLAAAQSLARAEEEFELPPVSDNAALQYWQAFAMLPALDADQEKLLESATTAALGPASVKLLEASRTSLMYLHRGAKLRRCDWGLDYRDGISLYLPHLAKARTLARIAALDTRRAFAAGQQDVARDNAFGMMALARQVGGDYTLVSMLVCYSIEGLTVDVMAPYVPEIKASYSDAMAGFETLPPSPRLAHAVMCEKRLAESIIRQLREAEAQQPGSWRAKWLEMVTESGTEAIKNIESLDEVIRLMDEFQSTYDELARLAALPPREFDAAFPEFAERAREQNIIAELLLPAMNKVVAAQRKAEVRMAMLLASIAVVEGGPERLAEIDDPFGEGPFGYEELASGFELRSGLTEDGKPVTLTVGGGE
jgi:hypothetical protein